MTLVALPLVIPLFAALAGLLVRATPRWRDGLGVVAGVLQVGVAVVLLLRTLEGGTRVMTVGAWPAPYGIVLVADPLAALMVLLGSITVAAGLVYGCLEAPGRWRHPLRVPLLQFLSVGLNLAFLTGDLFNLFVAFEILLVSSYALLTLEADDWDVKQAYPYLAMNVVGSTLFFCAAGAAYGLLGTLNMADMARRAAEMSGDPRLLGLALMLVLVFGLKAGLFPLYFWLPHSYPTLATPVAAVFAGLLTKVGIYALVRMFTTILPHDLTLVHQVVAWASGATMILGVLGAISRDFIRGILSFHILSQVAFMTLALGFFTPWSLAAALFYISHHIVVKSSLFLLGGVAAWVNRTDDLKKMGGLWRVHPLLGILFLLQALSLAGLPPLSGFWGKYLIVVEGLSLGEYVLVGISLVASVLTLFSMLKIWLAAFWSEGTTVSLAPLGPRGRGLLATCGVLAVISVGIGLGAQPVLEVARSAATSALDQAGYQEAVFSALGREVGR